MPAHKKLGAKFYSGETFTLLEKLVSQFSGILILPNVVTEIGNQYDGGLFGPALAELRKHFRSFITESDEVYVPSRLAAERREFDWLGITDAALLLICSGERDDGPPTLLTVDRKLARQADRLGLSVINFMDDLEYL